MKETIKKCKICEKSLIITHDYIACPKSSAHNHKRFADSDMAVKFRRNVWFCNKCWKKVTKKVITWEDLKRERQREMSKV